MVKAAKTLASKFDVKNFFDLFGLMKFRVSSKFSLTVYQLVRKLGYFPVTDPYTKKTSFIRKLSAHRYPRFHLYISENSTGIVFDLHLDQTAARYQGQTAHRADYNSPQVKEELTRIYHVISPFLEDKAERKIQKD